MKYNITTTGWKMPIPNLADDYLNLSNRLDFLLEQGRKRLEKDIEPIFGEPKDELNKMFECIPSLCINRTPRDIKTIVIIFNTPTTSTPNLLRELYSQQGYMVEVFELRYD